MKVEAVLFDWGETLGPVSAENGVAALPPELILGQEAFAAANKRLLGGPEPGLAALSQPGREPPAQAWRETTARELFRTTYRMAGRPWPTDPVQERALVLRHHIFLIAAMRAAPGAVEVLATLRDRGLRLGLVSNVVYDAVVVRCHAGPRRPLAPSGRSRVLVGGRGA